MGGTPPEVEGLRPGGGGGRRERARRGRDRAGVPESWAHCPPGGWQLFPPRQPWAGEAAERTRASRRLLPSGGTRTRVGQQRYPDWSRGTGRAEPWVAGSSGWRVAEPAVLTAGAALRGGGEPRQRGKGGWLRGNQDWIPRGEEEERSERRKHGSLDQQDERGAGGAGSENR